MLKRSLLILLLSTSSAAAQGATDNVSVNLSGIGIRACAYWLGDQTRRSEGEVWIYGFWSGLNYVAVASEQAQSKANGTAMIAAVEKLCRRDPAMLLAAAAWSAYIDLSKN